MASSEYDAVTDILATAKTIAVVGLSSNPYRSSFGVSESLQMAGYRIIPGESERDGSAGRKSL